MINFFFTGKVFMFSGKNMTTMAAKKSISAPIIHCRPELLWVRFVPPFLTKIIIKTPERKSKTSETIILMINFFMLSFKVTPSF